MTLKDLNPHFLPRPLPLLDNLIVKKVKVEKISRHHRLSKHSPDDWQELKAVTIDNLTRTVALFPLNTTWIAKESPL